MNRVELVNGCIARAHSNIFIPSTLNGSNLNEHGLDEETLKENLEAASEVYIDRVQDAPFGNTTIKFFKGANDENDRYLQKRRDKLLSFLHDSKKAKQELKKEDPVFYQYCEEVWQVRSDRQVKGLPEQYVFFLYACYKPDCIHPVCKKGVPPTDPKWYDGGPSLRCLPMPIKDPKRPWGGQCKDCESCAGHYMSVEDSIAYVAANGTRDCVMEPPSVVLKGIF